MRVEADAPADEVTEIGLSLGLGPWRFLGSPWPWRSLAYAVTGALQGLLTVAAVSALLAAGFVLLVLVIGLAALPAILLLGIPVAKVERARSRLVTGYPIDDPHVAVGAPGPRAWLRTRLRERTTWRELGFAALVVFVLCWVDLAVLGLSIGVPVAATKGTLAAGEPFWGPIVCVVLGLPIVIGAAYLLAVWATARLALARQLLGSPQAGLDARLAEVSRSRARLVAAFESERRGIERDLHDGAQRHLVAVSMSLGLASLDLPPGTPGAEQVTKAQGHAERAMAELRAIIRGVSPPVLADRGLAAAVRDVASDLPVPVELEIELHDRLPDAVESTAYYCVSEALTNVVRHSAATRARVRLRQPEGVLVGEIEDDGRGGADLGADRGLAGLVDRLAAVGGRLRLDSPPGGPTIVRFEIRCPGGGSNDG